MTESLLSKANALLQEYRAFNAQVRQDQANLRNRKAVPMVQNAAPAETREEMLDRIHNRKPGPALNTDPIVPVTKICMNGEVIGNYSSIFESSGGEEFNLKNGNDQFIFLEKFYPDYPIDQWPTIFNRLLTRGTITKAEVPDFVRQLKRAY